jgi:hypothetical protein
MIIKLKIMIEIINDNNNDYTLPGSMSTKKDKTAFSIFPLLLEV